MYSVQTTVQFEYKYEKSILFLRVTRKKNNLPEPQYCV